MAPESVGRGEHDAGGIPATRVQPRDRFGRERRVRLTTHVGRAGSKRRRQPPTRARQQSGGTLPVCLRPIPIKGNEMQPETTRSTRRFFLHYAEMVAAIAHDQFPTKSAAPQ
jgi:hypothetical protein